MISLLALTGPTASGKTELALSLAERLDGEIVSCDSMQIYKRLDVGTAKPTAEERARATHHLIDFCEPTAPYSASDYARDAARVIADVTARGKTPLLVGGTGLYLDTLLRGDALQTPPANPAYREKYEREAQTDEGRQKLYDRLLAVDEVSARATHKNNVRRVLRALEIFDATGIPKSEWDKKSREASSRYAVKHITLDAHRRETLYERADARIGKMLEAGLLEEVERLYADGALPPEATAAQAIGYKELKPVTDGTLSLDAAVENMKLSTRHYIKRQLTWFRASGAAPLYIDEEDGTLKTPAALLCEALSLLQ